jgi:hypothetical protein
MSDKNTLSSLNPAMLDPPRHAVVLFIPGLVEMVVTGDNFKTSHFDQSPRPVPILFSKYGKYTCGKIGPSLDL